MDFVAENYHSAIGDRVFVSDWSVRSTQSVKLSAKSAMLLSGNLLFLILHIGSAVKNIFALSAILVRNHQVRVVTVGSDQNILSLSRV